MTKLRVDLVNATWQWAYDAQLLENSARGDVLAVVEARTADNEPVRVGRILGRSWQVVQNLATGATAGAAVAVRRDSPVHIRSRWFWRLSRAGRNVQQRDAVTVVLIEKTPTTVYETHLIVAHNPLRSTGQQKAAVTTARGHVIKARARRSRVQMRRAVTKRKTVVRWAVMGDGNMPPADWCKALGGDRFYGEAPMAIILGPGWGHVRFDKRNLHGADHAVLMMEESK
jgi:hypothetical protein